MFAAQSDTPVGTWRGADAVVPPRRAPEPATTGHGGQSTGVTALRLTVQWPTPGVVAVRIGGEVDLASLPRLTEMINQRLRAATLDAVVLDFSGVTFASSAALELLVSTRRRCHQRGSRLLVAADGPVARLLELTGLAAMFTLHPDLRTALAHA